MRSLVSVLFATAILLGLAGCSTPTATVSAKANFQLRKSMYVAVVKGEEEWESYPFIQRYLQERGYSVLSGPAANVPANMDCVFTPSEKWAWDVTTYLRDLTITVTDPKTGELLATGRSSRASLNRKSAENMTREVMDQTDSSRTATLLEATSVMGFDVFARSDCTSALLR